MTTGLEGEETLHAFRDTFAPLRNRNLAIYLAGQSVSLIGTWMQMTAQSWVVWRLSGSEAALGVVGMLGTLPFLVLGPLAGVWADRFDRRKILINTQGVAMLLAFTLAVLVQLDVVRLWHIYVLSTLLGCVSALDMPSQQAFIGDLAGMEMVRRAIVVNAMIIQVSRIFGPTLAGLVVRLVGEGPAFMINGISFIAVIASLLAVRANRSGRPSLTDGGGHFTEAIGFVAKEPRILDLMIFTGLVTFFGFSNAQIFPSFVDVTLKSDAGMLGLLMGASGAGALLSVLVIVPAAQRYPEPGRLLTVTVALAGIGFALLSLQTRAPLALAASFLSGVPTPVVLTTGNGLLQVLAPREMRARLLTLYLMLSFGLQPIASLWVGYWAERLGAPQTIRLNGICMLVAGLLMLLRPGLARWQPMPRMRPDSVK